MLFIPSTGKGEGGGHHFRTKGHQEEARRGQQAARAHPLGEEDPCWGSLALRCQVSPTAQPPNLFPFFLSYTIKLCSISVENSVALISFWWDHGRGLEQITSSQWVKMAGDIEMSAVKMWLFVLKYCSSSFSLTFVKLQWSNFTTCSGTDADIKVILHLLEHSFMLTSSSYTHMYLLDLFHMFWLLSVHISNLF